MRLRRMNPDVHRWPVRLMLMFLIEAVTCVPGISQTRQATLEIGSHVITLGVPVDGVISDLRTDYTVVPAGKSPLHQWLVSTGKDTLPLGAIYAKGNTVVGIEHLVGEREVSGNDQPQGIFDALFAASSKVAAKGRNPCIVTTGTDYYSGLSKAAIHLSCGGYRVRLQRNEFRSLKGEALTSYMVWEELGTTD